MKILHIITGLPTAGAQMALYRLLSNLDLDRFECSVISLMDRGPVGKSIEDLGIPLYFLDMDRRLPGWKDLNKFIRLIRKLPPPDLIQGWEYHGNLASSLAGWVLPNKPAVLWNIRHTPYNLRDEKWSTAVIIRLGAFLSHYVTTLVYNAEVARFAHEKLGYIQAKGEVIPNGFDLTYFAPSTASRLSMRTELGISPNAFVIGLIARFHPMKDHTSFLQAAGWLKNKYPNVQFILAGDGVDEENMALTGLIQEYGLSSNIRLLGECRDMPVVLASLDCLTLCSAWGEGFPNILGEAMSCGIPCVVTNVGDSGIMVGETGLIVAPKDSQALADAWEHFFCLSLQERQELGIRARQRIEENYTIEGMAKSYENLYEEVYRVEHDRR